MYDALMVAAVVDELNAQLVGGRIQQVAHADPLTLVLEVYAHRRRRWLVISADHNRTRALIHDERVGIDSERVTPMLLLLRKYARGGHIVAVAQPRFERIIRLSIAKPIAPHNAEDTDDIDDGLDDELAQSELIVEMMGRRSNIILVDEAGRIRDAIKRVTPEMSRVRPVRPGQTYVPPPPQEKLEPCDASVSELLRSAHGADERLDRWLVGHYQAVSPALAREVALRAGLEIHLPVRALSPDSASRVVSAMEDLFALLDTGDWEPIVYVLPTGEAIASPTRLISLESLEGVSTLPCDSVSAAVRDALDRAPASGGMAASRHAARRERLISEIRVAVASATQRVRSLEEQQALAENAAMWRSMGEAIFAATGSILAGASAFTSHDGMVITLDPTLTPTQNAQGYFERYRKSRSAAENVPALIEGARTQLDYLGQMQALARLAESFDEIDAVRHEWASWQHGKTASRDESRSRGLRPSPAARRPRSMRTSRGDMIWIGRSGPQNEQVTFDIAGPADLWLHARNMPGAHVILRWNGPDDDRVLDNAASIAAWYSDGRDSTTVLVDVTERRYVRKLRGGGPGMVTYRNERTLNVRPRSEADLRIERS